MEISAKWGSKENDKCGSSSGINILERSYLAMVVVDVDVELKFW